MLNERTADTFNHCKKILKLAEKYRDTSVEVVLCASEPIISFPSVLVVDNESIVITFITPTQEANEAKQPFIKFSGALIIRNRSGKTVSDIMFIVECFRTPLLIS